MAKIFCENRLTFLSDYHKSLLNQHFNQPSQTAQPRELAIKLGVEYPQVIAILAVISADGFCYNWLLIYHSCCETFVERRLLKLGRPRMPYICPYCQAVVYDIDELKLDVMAETKTPVEFI